MKSSSKYLLLLGLLGCGSIVCLVWVLWRTPSRDVVLPELAPPVSLPDSLPELDAHVLDAIGDSTLFQPVNLDSEDGVSDQPTSQLVASWQRYTAVHDALMAEATGSDDQQPPEERVRTLDRSAERFAATDAPSDVPAALQVSPQMFEADRAFLTRRGELWSAVREARQVIQEGIEALEKMRDDHRQDQESAIARATAAHDRLMQPFTQPGESAAFVSTQAVAHFLDHYLREASADDPQSRIRQLMALHPRYSPGPEEPLASIRESLPASERERLDRAVHRELGTLRIAFLQQVALPLDRFLDAAYQIRRQHDEVQVRDRLRQVVNARLLAEFPKMNEPALDEGTRETVTAVEHLIVLGAYEVDPDDSLVFRYWYSLLDRRNKRPHRSFVFLGGEYAETETSKQVLRPPEVPFILRARRTYNQLVADLHDDPQNRDAWQALADTCQELERQAAEYRGYVRKNEAKPNAVFPVIHRQDYAEISFAQPAEDAAQITARLHQLNAIWSVCSTTRPISTRPDISWWNRAKRGRESFSGDPLPTW